MKNVDMTNGQNKKVTTYDTYTTMWNKKNKIILHNQPISISIN